MKTTTTTTSLRRGLIWLGVFAALFFAVLLLCAPKAEAYVVDSGNCGADGDNVKWSLDSDGTLTISGKGKMADNQSWENYQDDIKKGVIKNGVTSIGEMAFWGCEALIVNKRRIAGLILRRAQPPPAGGRML